MAFLKIPDFCLIFSIAHDVYQKRSDDFTHSCHHFNLVIFQQD
jgi:hypothetical protein